MSEARQSSSGDCFFFEFTAKAAKLRRSGPSSVSLLLLYLPHLSPLPCIMSAYKGLHDTLSDEQLAFLLQQEEYEAFQQASFAIASPTASSSASTIPKHEHTHGKADVIVLDDSCSEEEQKVVAKVQKKAREEDEIGILDVHELFVKYNDLYFHGLLAAVTVEWSAKMTLCAGLCSWRRNGDCRIKLSSKLLQFRSNKELKETLLVRTHFYRSCFFR